MRPLRALVVAIGVLVGPALHPLGAQEGWNDDRTRALVLAAIQRRAAQLADTGLTDYTAEAHGYVTFLAQLGAGFPLPPAVVKSDELMVEVYWGAPDRSKQRIIGRRDTLLLPTDINYHRDHLAIVQNNFPAFIRLGDGDEVRDVPHPLSAAGYETYDYRITDSLAIRTSDRAIDVIMVSVRPKDDRTAAAVGAVYIDRVTASVIRMTLSFTRAALRDPQLEDVSVILENGLVEGRFWLPRRQEIEIRRSATWMDFPARGIIRGRWEICCVRTNTGALPAVGFAGPEVSEAPRAEQRRYPFEGTLLGGLPEEVRALDATDVRRVQEEARALVRATALARPRKPTPSARSVSDLVRVNRVEGLALGFGFAQAAGAGVSTAVGGRYGMADSRFKGRASVAWESARGDRLTVEGRDDFAEAGDVAEVSGLRNSIAAQEFGSDWTDPYRVSGGALTLGLAPGGRSRLSIALARERHGPLAVHAVPSTGRYEPTLAAERLQQWRLTAGWSRAGTGDPSAAQLTFAARVTGALAERPRSGETNRYARASFEMEALTPFGGGRLLARTMASAVSAGEGVPVQSEVFLGGPVTAPGYGFHSIRGRAGVAQRLEYQARIPFGSLRLGRFGTVPSTLTIAPFVQGAAALDGGSDRWGWYPSIGLGTIGLFDLLRIDVARALRGGRWMFSVDVSRELWPVM